MSKTEQTPDKVTKLSLNVDSILKHAEKLNQYTKTYNWLTEREQSLAKVFEAYKNFKAKEGKNADNIFVTDNEKFPFKIVLLDANDTYVRDAVVEIKKPEVVGAFVNTLLEFLVEEKTKVFEQISNLEQQHAKDLVKG